MDLFRQLAAAASSVPSTFTDSSSLAEQFERAFLISRVRSIVEGVVWVALCVAWHAYHYSLKRRGVFAKSTKPVSFFVACEAITKGITFIFFAFDAVAVATGASYSFGISVLLVTAFVGLAFTTLFCAIGFGVVRDYGPEERAWIARAMVVIFVGPVAVFLITIGVAAFYFSQSNAPTLAALVVMGLFVFVGFLTCLGFYGFVFYKLSTQTLQMIPNSRMPFAQQADFEKKFRVMRALGLVLMVILVLTLPTSIFLLIITTSPLVPPILSTINTIFTIAFGVSMCRTYMLSSDHQANDVAVYQVNGSNNSTEFSDEF